MQKTGSTTMPDKKEISRREFLKFAGLAGTGSVLLPGGTLLAAGTEAEQEAAAGPIPVRPFGKTGVNVSCLSLGTMFDTISNQLLLRQALKWGVTYWDTADCYEGGNSEVGIGQFIKKNPEARQKLFLVSKSDKRDPKGLSELLDRSLRKLNTNYLDLYFVHGISGISEINNETKAWAEKAKSQGKIKFFGFSAHSNMEDCMVKAAKLGWIDGIMITYNFRLMRTDKMRAAVEACSRAGIGLTAMKTQGGGQVSSQSETELEMAGKFLKKGFTDCQAKIKAVWEEPNIASVCSQMPSMTVLMSNVAAALDKTKLAASDLDLLDRYAAETAHGYCTGCTNICEPLLAGEVPIGDIMRFLMYHNSYGDVDRARASFAEISPEIRDRLTRIDYSRAENLCPQKLRIRKLVRHATEVLTV
jgi:uncharacterized protein